MPPTTPPSPRVPSWLTRLGILVSLALPVAAQPPCAAAAAATQPSRPNVVLVMTDDQIPDHAAGQV